MLQFARAHFKGDFLRPGALELLWTPQTTADGTPTRHGIGWPVARLSDGKQLRISGGNTIGGPTVIFVLPEEEVNMVFMKNMGNVPTGGVR